MNEADLRRFYQKVRKTDGCWLWTACVNPHGYGNFCVGGITQLAHRVSYEIHKGPIPEGLFVCHHCDVPGCVNPEHLFVGTHRDNQRDSSSKGRCRNHNTDKTHCKYGHEFTLENTYAYKPGTRACKACWRRRKACKVARNKTYRKATV